MLLSLGIVLGAVAQASAAEDDSFQPRPPAVLPVYQMPRPAYDSPKITLGSFLAAPSLSQTLAYEDNLFASDRHKAGDFVSTTGEEFSISSQWQRDSVKARGYFSQQFHADHPTEDANIYGVEGNARLDVSDSGSVGLDAGFVQQPQARNNAQADRLAVSRPIYNTLSGTANYAQDLGRFHNSAEIEARKTAYISKDDATRSGVQLRYRDRLDFAVTGDVWAFVQGSYATQNWLLNGSQRNFDTVSGLAGVSAQIAEMLDVELGMGILRQDYRSAGFRSLVTPTYNGRLTWNILPLTTVTVSVARTVSGLEIFCTNAQANPACADLSGGTLSILASQRGALQVTSTTIGVQHEFWHDFLGELRFRHERDKFDPVDLVDRNYFVDMGAHFLIDRNLELDVSYAYGVRTANQDLLLYNSGPYHANTISILLKAAV